MKKMLRFRDKARQKALAGVMKLARAVKATLGPKGRNVVIDKGFGTPTSTKDGVAVAQEIVLADKFENLAAQVVKQAAAKTSEIAGDGTTTAIVLAEALVRGGTKAVTAGANPMLIKQGIDKAVEAILKKLRSIAVPIETADEVKQIAAISANNDMETGAIISEAMSRVGKDGIISVVDNKSTETELRVVEGTQFKNGYVSPYLVTNPETMSAEYDNPSILLIDKKLSSAKELVPILEKAMNQRSMRPLVIIAEEIEGEALATLVVNRVRGQRPICGVKAPGFGDKRKALLQDIAILTGGKVVSEETGMKLEQIDTSVFGSAKRIKIDKEETTIIDGQGQRQQIQERIAHLRAEIANPATNKYDREKLEERLAQMAGGVAVIALGGATETELKEKKARVEDALHATRAAVAEGIVPGGGKALLMALPALDSLKMEGDVAMGIQIVREALFEPTAAIATNCGLQGALIAEKVAHSPGNVGYNGLTGVFEDLIKAGVIDPVKVTCTALINAASVASMLLTTECMITDKPERKSKAAMGGGMDDMDGMGGMGGMGMGGMGMGGMGMM